MNGNAIERHNIKSRQRDWDMSLAAQVARGFERDDMDPEARGAWAVHKRIAESLQGQVHLAESGSANAQAADRSDPTAQLPSNKES